MREIASSEDLNSLDQVRVVVRCRPMSNKEQKAGYKNVINAATTLSTIEILDPREPKSLSKKFTFDAVYDFTSNQEQLYHESVKPMVDAVLGGFNATIFAYGQTGTGKTYTMEGLQSTEKGVVPRSFNQIFDHITTHCSDTVYKVCCSYVEIYQEVIKDLLNTGSKPYELCGNQCNIHIRNLKYHICNNAVEMENTMKIGNMNRKTGATDLNEHSSRSHAIFIITIEVTQIISNLKHVKVGKLNLVDLAGSERQTKSNSTGMRLKEAAKINLSLSALGNVISALGKERNSHIPYRDSKLTRLLQDSLGGNSKTLMIANIGPACYNYTESLNTLKYANRAKNIKNKPMINENSTKDELIHNCQMEIERLQHLIHKKYPERALKENRNNMLNKINDIQNTLCNEQSQLFNTSRKIEYIQNKKDDIEHQAGTDIKTFTESQRHRLKQVHEELLRVESNKQELQKNIKTENNRIKEIQELSEKVVQDTQSKIEVMHNVYNNCIDIKEQATSMRKCLTDERNEIEMNRNRLLKKYGMNQILIDYFIPTDTKQPLKSKVEETEEVQLTNLEGAQQQLETRFHYSTQSNSSESYDSRKQLSSNSSSTTTRKSKFKDTIIVHTNKLGIKQFIDMEESSNFTLNNGDINIDTQYSQSQIQC